MLILYIIFACATVTTGVTVFFVLRKKSLGVAILAAVVTTAACGLLFPIPIHGGFTIVLEELIENFQRDMALRERSRENENQRRFLDRLTRRFDGAIPYLEKDVVSKDWTLVVTSDGMDAWLDRKSGLIWSDPMEWAKPDRPTIEEAKAFCRSQSPAGHWALPTAAELTLFWKNGGEAISPSGSRGSLSVIIDTTFRMEFPSYDLGDGRGFSIRCVARSPMAPGRGYIKDDIPLEVWNRYQLEKLSGNQTNPTQFHQ